MQKGFGPGMDLGLPEVNADNTIYDLASLSKVIRTTTAAMILFDEGRLDLDAPGLDLHPRVLRRQQGTGHGPSSPHAPLRAPGRSRTVADDVQAV